MGRYNLMNLLKKPILCMMLISSCCLNGMDILGKKSIRIATYNIRRGGSEINPKNLWDNRKNLVYDLIHTINPDIIGFQEVVQDQLNDLKSTLSGYDYFGLPRSEKMNSWLQSIVMMHPSAKDEGCYIFFNTATIELIDSGDFGINPVAKYLPAYLPRICTWGHFRNKNTHQEFYVYNTHLDNKSSDIRRKQIRQICSHIKKHARGKAVFFMGDLNTNFSEKRENKGVARCQFTNTRTMAQSIEGPLETRTGWENNELKTIDHIFVNGAMLTVARHVVVASPPTVFPSDHRPVYIDVVMK